MYGLEGPWGGIDGGNSGLEGPQAWLAFLQHPYDDWTTAGWDDWGGDWGGYEGYSGGCLHQLSMLSYEQVGSEESVSEGSTGNRTSTKTQNDNNNNDNDNSTCNMIATGANLGNAGSKTTVADWLREES